MLRGRRQHGSSLSGYPILLGRAGGRGYPPEPGFRPLLPTIPSALTPPPSSELPDPRRGEHVRVSFLGAARCVTGSNFLVETPRSRVLVDCGMFQGGREERELNDDPFEYRPGDIDAAVLTHAHIDHCGRIPLLHKRGFDGPVHGTRPTCDLVGIMLRDSAKIQEGDAAYRNRRLERRGKKPKARPLYTLGDAENSLDQFTPHEFGERVQVTEDVSVRFRHAGHILGAAQVDMWVRGEDRERLICFSGDLGRDDMPLLREPDTGQGEPDLVLMESTYGDRLHRGIQDTLDELEHIVDDAHSEDGNVLIPVFAVGRAQAILAHLAELERKGADIGRVYLDTPMGIDVTALYARHKDTLRPGALEAFDGRLPMPHKVKLTHDREESVALNEEHNAIIMSASGMMDAGRIQHHLKHNLWKKQTQIVVVGYQANGSVGRRLVDGARSLKLFGERIAVNAKIHTLGGFSAHADQRDLVHWFEGFRTTPPKVCLVHGEPLKQQVLAEVLHSRFDVRAQIPGVGDTVTL